MRHAKLLDRQPQPVPVRTDVFIHNLDAFTLEALRRALEQGLTPSGLDFTEMMTLSRFSASPGREPEKREEREAALAAQGES